MLGGDELQKECRLGQKVGHATGCGWLKQFECVYTLKGKTSYVDMHEREEVVQTRHELLAEFNKVAPSGSLSSGTSLTLQHRNT